jgi:transcriptional regulator with XRE-family HTH domain
MKHRVNESTTLDEGNSQTEVNWRSHLSFRLRNFAAQNGLKGAEVARAAGISAKAYNNYVNGRRMPGPPELMRIAGALGVSVDELIGIEPLVSDRDADSWAAMRRFHTNAIDLSASELELLADVAMTLRERDTSERRELHDRSALRRLILAHEELLPAILRKYKPVEFEAFLVHCDDDHDWLDIGLVLERGIDASRLAAALRELAHHRMEAKSNEIYVDVGKSQKRGIPVRVRLRLDRTRKPSNDAGA